MIFKGAPYPIRQDPMGYFRTQTSIDQIKSDLLILLLTTPGSRCLAGDTLIPLARGEDVPIKDLVGQPPFYVYSYDRELNKIVSGLATASQTVKNAELLKVTLDNNESVFCTKDHLWMLRNGDYKRADELQHRDSLMPLYRGLTTSGYERIYQPYLSDKKETHLCFVEGTCLRGEREVVYHKDLNKKNNDPTNLQWMTSKDHNYLHKQIFNKRLKEDPEFYENWHNNLVLGLRKYYESHDGSRKGAILSDETKKKLSEDKKRLYSSPEGDGNPSKRPDVREKLKQAWVERRKKNHKVLSIETTDLRQDCYDLHVEKYHNFGLSCGAFVHNCMLPDFGTPLKQLIFEPNDAALANRARDMIIESIRKWEPRIVVEDIEVSSSIDVDSLSNDDPRENIDNILSIRILFYDPENIKMVQELKLDIPLSGVG